MPTSTPGSNRVCCACKGTVATGPEQYCQARSLPADHKALGMRWLIGGRRNTCLNCSIRICLAEHRVDYPDEVQRARSYYEEAVQKTVGGVVNYETLRFSLLDLKQHPNLPAIVARLKQFDASKDNIYLHGVCGTGKTHMAVSTAVNHLESLDSWFVQGASKTSEFEYREEPPFLRVRFFLMAELMSLHRDPELMNTLLRTPLLLIDDIGVGHFNDFTIDALFSLNTVITKRYSAGRNGLVLTSNLNLQQLGDKLKFDGLPSRLAQMCEVIKFEGDDYRLKEK